MAPIRVGASSLGLYPPSCHLRVALQTGPGRIDTWIREQGLEDILQGEPDLPLRSKAIGRTVITVRSAVGCLSVNMQPPSDNEAMVST